MDYSDFCKHIGSKLINFRSLKNLSIGDVANYFEVPLITVINWEKGIDPPSMYQFFLLMNYLDFSFYDL